MAYIHQLSEWPAFTWNYEAIANKLADVCQRQGRLLGRMESLGFSLREEAILQTLTTDAVRTSEIEGIILDKAQVRSSIARRLGIDIGGQVPVSRNVEGVVEMILDATQHYDKKLTKARIFGWHAALFPTGYSEITKIRVGKWRNDATGPMQVISGAYGREWVHFEAPPAERIEKEMQGFLAWFNNNDDTNRILRAGIAHLWFVTLHPFDDGNGRIARAITDMMLARSERTSQRFYSMSAQIRLERTEYYRILEETQKGTLDITDYLSWFLACLDRALDRVEESLHEILQKARFWEAHREDALNDRQKLLLNKLLDGFEGKLTSSKWAKIAKCSQDTAQRDIAALVERGILQKEAAGGRSTSYDLKLE